jgi:hypothetical protein
MIKWLKKNLIKGAPIEMLTDSYTHYADLMSVALNEKEKKERVLRATIFHILDNDFMADPVALMLWFQKHEPEMSIEELLMLMFKLGILIKDYADDKEVFLSAVKGLDNLPEKYKPILKDMEDQVAFERKLNKAAEQIEGGLEDPAMMQGYELTQPTEQPGASPQLDIKASLKNMSSGELNDLLNELITAIEKKNEQLKRIEKINKKSKEE